MEAGNECCALNSGYWTRDGVDGNYTASATETYWYSPEAKWWVKREYHDRTPTNQTWTQIRNELTEIQVKN